MADPIIVPRRLEDWFDPGTKQLTLRALKFFELITGTTNTAVINIDSNEQALTSTGSRVSRNAARINSLELKAFELIETSASITTEPFQIIDCINTVKVEITLDPDAIGADEVHIARSGATVDIIGIVNGKTNIRLNIKGFSVHLIKQITGPGWLQI